MMTMRVLRWLLAVSFWAVAGVGVQARTLVEEGVVLLEVLIAPSGQVESTMLLDAPSVKLAAAVTQQVRANTFDPPRYRGEAVQLQTVLSVAGTIHREDDGSEVVAIEFTSDVLIPLEVAAPVYPADALVAGREGWVDLDLSVGPDGVVTSARVRASEPAGVFDASALEAIRRFRFHTDRINGNPIGRSGTYRLVFSL